MLPSRLTIAGLFLACASAACESGSDVIFPSAPQSAEPRTTEAFAADATPSGAIVDRIRVSIRAVCRLRPATHLLHRSGDPDRGSLRRRGPGNGRQDPGHVHHPAERSGPRPAHDDEGHPGGVWPGSRGSLRAHGSRCIARGTGRLVFHNSNVFVDDSKDTKSGYIVTGDVTLPDGRRAHLHARLRLRIVDGEFLVLTEEFTLRPIGG